MYMFNEYEASESVDWNLAALSLSTAPIPGEECSPVALRLAEPWSGAGLGCLAAALATLFRDGERLWRADTLFCSALLRPTSTKRRDRIIPTMHTLVKSVFNIKIHKWHCKKTTKTVCFKLNNIVNAELEPFFFFISSLGGWWLVTLRNDLVSVVPGRPLPLPGARLAGLSTTGVLVGLWVWGRASICSVMMLLSSSAVERD